ncbi:membrane fusion protein, multidrug efflux system [Modicisalibacter muralis]|uniref:Membrane fusion protein, multidrug efflux system n=1 Tax=Modicisalibacter muralis TaxID=119000 RepID=A0A1G9GXC9_9GAMM|nr:efflux RND transporter periplasmic adaptor subunit [Halomonas muralis]SDL05370.1 membrane fusion protein, multidrug efflux system [Halomonas muralis]
MKKPLPTLRSTLLTFSFLLAFSIPLAQAQQASSPAVEVGVAQVVQHKITEWDEFTGRLEAPESVEIRPRVSGFIDTVNFDAGSTVQKGDVLFEIDPRPFEVEVRRLEAEFEQAQANLERAANEARRGERLKASNAISTERAEARISEAQQARAQVAAIGAELDAARLELSFTQVRAPIDGHIGRAEVTAGNLVGAGQTLLTTLVSTDRVYAYFNLDERTYLEYQALIQQGERGQASPVYLGLAGEPGYPHLGHIDFIDNQVDPMTGTIRGRAVFDNDAGLFTPGLFARLKLVGSARYDAVLIQETAVGTDLDHKFVLVLDDQQKVSYRQVELGPKVAGLRIVRDGLAPGDRIVVNGLQRVRSGMTVSPEIVPMANAATLARLERQQQRVEAALAASRVLNDNDRLTASATPR